MCAGHASAGGPMQVAAGGQLLSTQVACGHIRMRRPNRPTLISMSHSSLESESVLSPLGRFRRSSARIARRSLQVSQHPST